MRQLQSVLIEREESLKKANFEKSRIELESQGLAQRLRSFSESEQRYKDENWSLETQTHDLIAAVKESTDKEQRVQQLLTSAISEKGESQRELDDIKQVHVKILEEHTAFRRIQEHEILNLRRGMLSGEQDKQLLQHKVDELTSQNHELAKAIASHLRNEEIGPPFAAGSEPEDLSLDRSETEYSPPPSPSKGATRHTILESETIKSSLHHAHRMIQNLKSNIHREKSEKLELKRMLQESKDELEMRRNESSKTNNFSRRLKSKNQLDFVKKNAKLSALGMSRNSHTDIDTGELEWEDHRKSPNSTPAAKPRSGGFVVSDQKHTDTNDAYQTANETEDPFETANERDTATETEAFQTGAESIPGETSDYLTETEEGPRRSRTVRDTRSTHSTIGKRNRTSFISTASTSCSDDDRQLTNSVPAHPQKYRLKINRNTRRSLIGSEGPTNSNFSSIKSSPMAADGQAGQSLFTELGELNAQYINGKTSDTPSRASSTSQRSSMRSRSSTANQKAVQSSDPSGLQMPMVHSGMMTEPWSLLSRIERHHNTFVEDTRTADPDAIRTKDVGVQISLASNSSVSGSIVSPTQPERDRSIENIVWNLPTLGTASTPAPVSDDVGVSQTVQPKDMSIAKTSSINTQPYEAPPAKQQLPPSYPNTWEVTPPLSFSFSSILFSETNSLQSSVSATSQSRQQRMETEEERLPGGLTYGLHPSRAGERHTPDPILGSGRNGIAAPPFSANTQNVSDMTVRSTKQDSRASLKETPANSLQQSSAVGRLEQKPLEQSLTRNDGQDSQTMFSPALKDSLSQDRSQYIIPANTGRLSNSSLATLRPLSDIGATSPFLQSNKSQEAIRSVDRPLSMREGVALRSSGRPGSSGSIRASSIAMLPPLPADHRQTIAAAAAQRPVPSERGFTNMGPPTATSSAYRSTSNRSRTPGEPRIQSPDRRAGTTFRPRYSTTRSRRSRRSSVSSFASELDERFNIRADGMTPPQGMGMGTDPRMIQAITQTMIGEYLWKYTRKAGRGEMSDNRHRRFFWVHPYTRTLYWSEQDPSTAGRAQLKAKSVAIEKVQVIADDNPFPPGLHRKSLLIFTPGRSIKFTASTGQRHETWFNALSYVLIRTGHESDSNQFAFTNVTEFNHPHSNQAANTSGSRLSSNSYASRNRRSPRPTSRQVSPRRSRSPKIASQFSPQPHTSSTSRYSDANQGSISSRFSHYWHPSRASVRGSISSHTSKQRPGSNIHESEEDLRRETKKNHGTSDRLENVRTCCDGKRIDHHRDGR